MKEREQRLNAMYDRAKAMVDRIKQVKSQIRGSVRKLNVGVQFEGQSNLELKNPDNLEELAVKTEVSMYFNVTDKESDERAFLMYMGNEVGGDDPAVIFNTIYLEPLIGRDAHEDATHLDRRLHGCRARGGRSPQGWLPATGRQSRLETTFL